MTVSREWMFVVVGVLVVAGCSAPQDGTPRGVPAYCRDLVAFHKDAEAYRANVRAATPEQLWNGDDLGRQALLVIEDGASARLAAPDEIADDVQIITQAVARSANMMGSEESPAAIVNVLYQAEGGAAYDALAGFVELQCGVVS